MRHLNYSHLQYFWAVAREGSIVAAAETLHITPQTISGQLKMLEESLGQPLFNRVGRRLELTDLGHTTFEYADEIFSIGAELANVVRGQHKTGPLTFKVGVVSSMPKLVAERIIAPAFNIETSIKLRCIEKSLNSLLGDLATHRLDLVLSDQPMPQGLSLRAYNHRLGESGMTFFARKVDARKYKPRFPNSLNGAPLLMPAPNSALHRRLDAWFYANDISPNIVGEFDDSALMKAFGEAGVGIFVGPTAIEKEICTMYRASAIGRTNELTEQFYAISPERRLKHPAVVLITEAARSDLFSGG
ncbi:MAG: transcriptional activator NhaR [Pseudomonadota bacterium]